jgi:hypothetical protein
MAQVVTVDTDGLIKAAATVAEHLQGAATPPTGALPPAAAPSPADVAAAQAAGAIRTRIAAVSTELAVNGPKLRGVTTVAAGTLQAQDAENADRIAAVRARRGIQAAGSHLKQGGGPGDDVPPDDPKEFYDWWHSLSPAEKDRVYSNDHDIGNHPGMPWDPSDPADPNNFHLGKDHYNRLHLPELEQQTQADVDRMQHSLDELMADRNADDGAIYALQSQLAAVKNHLQGYKAVDAELNSTDGPRRYLGQLDEFGRGAIALNNPDTATHNAILVPGTGQDLTTIGGADGKALRMYNAALQADRSLGPQDVAVTTWMGYDRPMSLDHADFPDPARAGAADLDAFEAGQRASHVGNPSIDTVIGHSYGSTVLGAAASGGHQLDANDVIAVGSPGMLVDHAGDLSLAPGGHVYAMRAQNDIIGLAGGTTQWTLGPEPDKPGFGAIDLQADPGPTGPFGLPSTDAHSSYWGLGNTALLNMGSIIAGTPPPYVIGRQ